MIPNIAADKKLNSAADKAVNNDKRLDSAADKKLNIVTNKAIDANKKQDTTAGKQPNAMAEPSMLIKDQITK